MRLLIIFALTLMGASAQAAGKGGLDTTVIFWQAVNVTILFSALFYFLKNPVQNHFKEKAKDFVAAAEKAQSARVAAEAEHKEITVRLSTLEATANESVTRAQAEAAEMKKTMIAEAEALAARIRQEAKANTELEAFKARTQVRAQLLALSMAEARQQISAKVTGEDHKRLQGDFINNIQAVQR